MFNRFKLEFDWCATSWDPAVSKFVPDYSRPYLNGSDLALRLRHKLSTVYQLRYSGCDATVTETEPIPGTESFSQSYACVCSLYVFLLLHSK